MKTGAFWTMIFGGVVTLGAPLIGLLGTVLGMMRSFAVLGENGVADPKGLAESVGQSLMASMSGLFIGGFGLVIFLGGLIIWLAAKSGKVPPPIPADAPHS